MSIIKCTLDGKPGWKNGKDGTCHTYDPDSASGSTVAKAKAIKEMVTPKTNSSGGKNFDGQVQI